MEPGTLSGKGNRICPICGIMVMLLHKDAFTIVAKFIKARVRQSRGGFGQGIMPSITILIVTIQDAGVPVCVSSQDNMQEGIPLIVHVGAEVDVRKAIFHADGNEISVIGEDVLESSQDLD